MKAKIIRSQNAIQEIDLPSSLVNAVDGFLPELDGSNLKNVKVNDTETLKKSEETARKIIEQSNFADKKVFDEIRELKSEISILKSQFEKSVKGLSDLISSLTSSVNAEFGKINGNIDHKILLSLESHKNEVHPNSAMAGENNDIVSLNALKKPIDETLGGLGTRSLIEAREKLGMAKLASRNDINGTDWNGDDLSVRDGGTGCSVLNGILKGDGTSPIKTAEPHVDYMPGTKMFEDGAVINIQGRGAHVVTFKELKKLLEQ